MRNSTKIGDLDDGVSDVISPFGRNDKKLKIPIKSSYITYMLKKIFFNQLETPLNQRLLKINSKTLDNAYLTIVYLHTIYNFR
jgi:hypothetical protein